MSTKAQRDQLREEAANWVVRFSDEPRAEELAQFEAWRATSLEHELAYEHALVSWSRLDRLASLRAPQIVPDPDLLLSLDASAPQPRFEPAHRRPVSRWLAMAACLVLTVALGYSLIASVLGAPAYATGIGERRLIVLNDGTRVELNTNSRIVVHYAEDRREVELVRGEAMLHVASDPRAFVLRTEFGRLRASKLAEVDVRIVNAGAQVTIKQGSVESLEASASGPRLLGPSSEALFSGDAVRITPIAVDAVDRKLAWREGAIALDGQTIDEAVAEINRYNARRIIVEDRATGTMRVGGYFQTLDVDEFATALAKTFALDVVRQSNGDLVIGASGRVGQTESADLRHPPAAI